MRNAMYRVRSISRVRGSGPCDQLLGRICCEPNSINEDIRVNIVVCLGGGVNGDKHGTESRCLCCSDSSKCRPGIDGIIVTRGVGDVSIVHSVVQLMRFHQSFLLFLYSSRSSSIWVRLFSGSHVFSLLS